MTLLANVTAVRPSHTAILVIYWIIIPAQNVAIAARGIITNPMQARSNTLYSLRKKPPNLLHYHL